MTRRHWKLTRDPFAGPSPAYVALPPHEEAVARLLHAIEAGDRSAVLDAGPGLGKTVVLRETLARTRHPGRRIALVSGPPDGLALWQALATALGMAVSDRGGAWSALRDALRLCRLRGQGVVLAIDDAHLLADRPVVDHLDHLAHLDPHPSARVTILRVGRPPDGDLAAEGGWGLRVGLGPLTRSEAERYLLARLSAAGRTEPTFTPRAVSALHALSGGVPKGLDRLASLALMAGALRGLEVVGPEVIGDVLLECAPVTGAG